MRRKCFALLLAGLMLFGLTGCSLARPEREAPEADHFVGFHLVYQALPGDLSDDQEDPAPTPDRSAWVEYGQDSVEIDGMGSVLFPREVLFGVYDETHHDFDFPGLPGYDFFVYEYTEDSSHVSSICSDLANNVFRVGDDTSISGTLYVDENLGGEDPDMAWTAYAVFATPDGRVYLDGTGDSYSVGGNMTFSQTHTYTETVNGETRETSIKAEVRLEGIAPLEGVTVYQYGEDGALLGADRVEPSLQPDPVSWQPGAAWAIVAEERTGKTVRTCYDRPGPDEMPVSHLLILLGEDGFGQQATLELVS